MQGFMQRVEIDGEGRGDIKSLHGSQKITGVWSYAEKRRNQKGN